LQPKKIPIFSFKSYPIDFFHNNCDTFTFKEPITTGKYLPAPVPTPIKPGSTTIMAMDSCEIDS